MTFNFKEGTSLEGEIVAKAEAVLVVKTANGFYYLINRFELSDEKG